MDFLKSEIAAYKAAMKDKVPDGVRAIMAQCTTEIKESGIERRALKTGDMMPDFELNNQYNELRRLSDYLADSPVVLNIYRGGWCPSAIWK